jgi:predicted 3-demethylubiquinone-9 3-methyltransferase (glyoxalase superfamily)
MRVTGKLVRKTRIYELATQRTVKDKFGLAWQIVPQVFLDLLTNSDDETRDRVMSAMMKMKKLDIETLEQAAAKL